jgi:hypothetical protein
MAARIASGFGSWPVKGGTIGCASRFFLRRRKRLQKEEFQTASQNIIRQFVYD